METAGYKSYELTKDQIYRSDKLTKRNASLPCFGVFVNNINNEYTRLLCEGIAREVGNSANLNFFIGGTLKNPYFDSDQRNKIYNFAGENEIDGLIVCLSSIGGYVGKNEIESFVHKFKSVPMVTIGEQVEGIPCVLADNYQGMSDLLEHFIIHHSKKSIAFIKGNRHHCDTSARYAAYKDVLVRHGIPVDPKLVIDGAFDTDYGSEAIQELIDTRKVRFDVIICPNDYVAINIKRELESRNIRVPEDILLSGFDNIPDSQFHSITTVHQQCAELGSRAVDMLKLLLKGELERERTKLSCHLSLRESCGCSTDGTIPKMNINNTAVNNHEMNLLRFISFRQKTGIITELSQLVQLLEQQLPFLGISRSYLYLFDNHKYRNCPDSRGLYGSNNTFSIIQYNFDDLHQNSEKIGNDLAERKIKGNSNVFSFTIGYKNDFLGLLVFVRHKKFTYDGTGCIKSLSCIGELLAIEIENILIKVRLYKLPEEKAVFQLPENTAQKYYSKLTEFMTKHRPYLDDNLSLTDLAKDLEISRNYLSIIINKYEGKNFYEFINKYRLDTALELMFNDNNVKIIDIAYKSGFKSKSTFNKTFRKQLKTTPSVYMKNIRENRKS